MTVKTESGGGRKIGFVAALLQQQDETPPPGVEVVDPIAPEIHHAVASAQAASSTYDDIILEGTVKESRCP